MWTNKDEYILRCNCGDIRHLVHLYFGLDDYDLCITLDVQEVSIFQRIKNAFFYIVNQRKFWHYGDIVLTPGNPKSDQELSGLIEFLQRAQKESSKRG